MIVALLLLAQDAYFDKSSAEHQAEFTARYAKGQRIVSLSVYGTPDRYAAVWAKRDGPAWKAVHGVTAERFQEILDASAREGLQPTIVTATGRESEAVFAAVWERGGPPTVAKHHMTPALMERQHRWAYDNGYRLRWAAVYGDAANPRYAAIWEQNLIGAGWSCWFGDAPHDLRAKLDVLRDQRIDAPFVTPAPGGRYFSLFRTAAGADWSVHLDLDAAALRELLREQTPAVLQGDGTRFAAVFSKPAGREWRARGDGLEGFDRAMEEFVRRHGIRASALAVAKDGRLVHARGYTWAERDYPTTEPTSLFRIASCSKPITSIKIWQLIEQGRLEASPETIRLLGHAGGWDIAKLGFDPMFRDVEVARGLGRALPVTKRQIVEYMASRKPDPETKFAYSNYGYTLLGLAIEKVEETSYAEAVRRTILAPLGITRARIGKSERAKDEVWYHDNHALTARSVMSPERPIVAAPYGAWNLENMDAHGGWVMAAPDYARILAAFDRGELLRPETAKRMWSAIPGLEKSRPDLRAGWFEVHVAPGVTAVGHNGLLPGTAALAFRRSDGVSIVAFVNRDLQLWMTGHGLGNALNRAADAVSKWPEEDLFPKYGIR